MKMIWKSGVLLTAMALLTGCAKVPQGAVDSASKTIEDAERLEADVFATELFNAAQDSFAAAQTEIEVQNGKFILLRTYERAERQLESATELANQAVEAGVARKEELRTETTELVQQARQAVLNTRMLFETAPTGKEGRIALVAIGSDIDSVDEMFVQIDTLLAQDDVMAANELAHEALQKAQSLGMELQQAIEKTKTSRRS